MPLPIRYRIAPLDVHAHLIDVSCTIEVPDAAGQCFTLPAWTPGSYLIREFARHVVRIGARNAQGAVPLEKVGKARWRAAPCEGPLEVVAEIYAYDVSVRTAYADATRVYFNGTSAFLRPEGHEQAPCILDIDASFAASIEGARVATAIRGRQLRGARRPSGGDRPLRPHELRGGGRDARRRDRGRPRRRSRPGRARPCARLPVALRSLRRRPERSRALRPLPVPGAGGRRRLRRPRAPRLDEPRLQARRIAAHRRPGPRRRLPDVPRSRQPRIFPRVEREAHQAVGVHALRPVAGRLHAPPLGVRGHHVVLRRPFARAKRRRAGGTRARASRAHADDGPSHAGPALAERRRRELRRLDQVLPPRREFAERGRQLLREGRDRRTRAGPYAAPPRPLARRPDARAVDAPRRDGRRRRRGRDRGAGVVAGGARLARLLRALRRGHRGSAARGVAR